MLLTLLTHIYRKHFHKTIKEKYTTHLDLVIKVEKQNDTQKTVCLFLGGASFAFTQLLLFLLKGQLNRVVLKSNALNLL